MKCQQIQREFAHEEGGAEGHMGGDRLEGWEVRKMSIKNMEHHTCMLGAGKINNIKAHGNKRKGDFSQISRYKKNMNEAVKKKKT